VRVVHGHGRAGSEDLDVDPELTEVLVALEVAERPAPVRVVPARVACIQHVPAVSRRDGPVLRLLELRFLDHLAGACQTPAQRAAVRARVRRVPVAIDASLGGIDWAQAKADLAADAFDNGRSPEALARSFEQSQHVAIARDGERVVGMARLLSDGVCNAYLLDVWTASPYRRRGIASAMLRRLLAEVPGQHV